MIWFLALIIVALFAGIIFLSAKSSFKGLTREEYLQKLADFLEGEMGLIDSSGEGAKSIRIRFSYKDQEFVYEDIESRGFKDVINRAYLKMSIATPLTLTFSEKKRSGQVRSDIFIASDVSAQYMGDEESLYIPNKFEDLKIVTNSIPEANKILENKRIVSVLDKYKGVDDRGYSFLPFRINNGVVILEFRSENINKPSIQSLRENVSSIDDYLEQLLLIARQLKKKS